MLITRKSILDGLERTLDISVTEEQYNNWKSGMLIQDAMPDTPSDEREFIITGISPDEWDTLFEENENE
jgi:hypothetical protein